LTGVCCLGIIVVVGVALIWVYYGALPFVILGIVVGSIAVLVFYGSRQSKKTSEEAAAQERLTALEKRLEEEQFEKEQAAKGLVKFTDKNGNIRWGTPEEVSQWKLEESTTREVLIQREIVKIRCHYCGNLFDERLDKCPHCGGKQ